jgi:hypothetical protein
VGQTLLRLKDRFVNHFQDINTCNTEKSVSRHFSHPSHNGVQDLNISVLEFIRKKNAAHKRHISETELRKIGLTC